MKTFVDHQGRAVHFIILSIVITLIIIYGSLYPFEFKVPPDGLGSVHTLVASRAQISGRGDFIANVLLYIPFGLFCTLSIRRRAGFWMWCPVVVIGGVLLSIAMELTQYFVVERVTSADDVYANVIGTTLGSMVATACYGNRQLPIFKDIFETPVPMLLISLWLGYRLYPYVPTIDLHKYWHALKPAVLDPATTPYDLYRHTAVWLTLFGLIEKVVGARRTIILAPLSAGCILFARVLIVGTVLSVGEIVGAAVACCVWPFLLALHQRRRATVLVLLLGSYVVAERLQPFEFLPTPGSFGWVPFLSLMSGSIEVNVLSLLEKSFLYGSLIFLLGDAGWSRRRAAATVVVGLLATSWAQTYLPGRSAEITDTVIALALALGFTLLGAEGTRQTPPAGPRSTGA